MPIQLHYLSGHLSGHSVGGNSTWIYLGQDPTVFRKLSTHFSSPPLPISERLDAIAYENRSDFVRWIGLLASREVEASEAARFWEMTFTTRSPETSDLYPLICLGLLGLELAEKYAVHANANLSIWVDDPWLFQSLCESGLPSLGQQASFLDRLRQSLKAWLRLPAARGAFCVRGAARIFLARNYFKRLAFSRNEVALVSYAYARALRNQPYLDPFFGPLPERLAQQNWIARYLFPLHTPSSLFRSIAENGANVLARSARVSDLLRSLFARARLKPLGEYGHFKKLRIAPLLQRELLFENSSNRPALNRWQSLTWRRLAQESPPHSIAHIFENHTWEKSLNFALKDRCRRVGYQHSTIPDLLMNYVSAGKSEAEFHPGDIVANSPFYRDWLEKSGWDGAHLHMGGALRYSAQNLNSPSKRALSPNPAAVLFVALPGHAPLCRAMIDAIAMALPQVQRKTPLQILLKFHPSLSPDAFQARSIPGAQVTEKSLDDLKQSVDAVLFASTTVGLEAMLMGFSVARFLPEGLLTLDPLPGTLRSKAKPVTLFSLPNYLEQLELRQGELNPLIDESGLLYCNYRAEGWKTLL